MKCEAYNPVYASPSDRIEIVTSVQRRRRWSASEKVRLVEETYEPGSTVSLVARRHNIAPNQLFTWRRLVAQGAPTAAGAEEEVVPASDYRALQNQVRELHRLLGKKTLEAEILKEAIEVAAGPKRGCCACCHRRRVRDEERGGHDGDRPGLTSPREPDVGSANRSGGRLDRIRTSPLRSRRSSRTCRPTDIDECMRSCVAAPSQKAASPRTTSGFTGS